MKVLMCHNYYQQSGGEDESFAQEIALLESHGHEVVRFTKHNDDIRGMSPLKVASHTLWSRESSRELREIIRRERPAVMHCTNTFPLISPSAYYAARKEGVAVVQSLRNFRLFCPGAFFMRDGAPCESCLGSKLPWRAVQHRCYRDSHAASATVALMIGMHNVMGTWTRAVDAYFALTHFARNKFIEGGLPEEKISIKPNFLSPDPGPGTGSGDYCLFVGRLSPEKGLDTLLQAWSKAALQMPLKIVGDGPLSEMVARAAKEIPNIEWLGRREGKEVSELLGEAKLLMMPSVWYEGFPRTVIESFARGTPVVASRIGSLAEIVEHDRTGAHFSTGDSDDMARALREILQDPDRLQSLRQNCRNEFLNHYTADDNYKTLMSIYGLARKRRGGNPDEPSLARF